MKSRPKPPALKLPDTVKRELAESIKSGRRALIDLDAHIAAQEISPHRQTLVRFQRLWRMYLTVAEQQVIAE